MARGELVQYLEQESHDKVLDNQIGIWNCWFLRRGENRRTRRKTSRSKDKKQRQTRLTYDAETGNRTRVTVPSLPPLGCCYSDQCKDKFRKLSLINIRRSPKVPEVKFYPRMLYSGFAAQPIPGRRTSDVSNKAILPIPL